jgi:Domain of unknown function (DUF4267)
MKSVLVVVGGALVVVGLSALVVPDRLASGFGIGADGAGARAYVAATGTRDIAMGIWLLMLVWLGAARRILGVSVLVMSLVAAGDALNVAAHTGWAGSIALAGHLASFGILVCLGAWLLHARNG